MTSKIFVNCDGGSRGNPGKSAIGIVIYNSKKEVLKKYKKYLGITTNNFAEYTSLIESLKLASKFTKNELIIIMDSELVIKQMKGEYKVKAKHLLPLHEKAKKLSENFKKISFKHNSREKEMQQIADKLVNEVLDGD